MIEIDGSQGEGGGQVLRSALTLSIITGKEMRIINIRANRSKPGLKPQHLKAVDAAAAISKARVEGAALNSTSLMFSPSSIRSGRYKFDIGTAGSTSLVLQTIFLPLSLANSASSIIISGGTHVPWSPCFHYIDLHWMNYLHYMGFNADLYLDQAGFYPRGGGRITATVRPVHAINPIQLTNRGKLLQITGISGVANLDLSIAKRQKLQALNRILELSEFIDSSKIGIRTIKMPSHFKGTLLLLLAHFEYSQCCYFALGKLGKPAERVADEAVDYLFEFLETDGAVDTYLADQLLLPACLAEGLSEISTNQLTPHLETNAEIIQAFLPIRIEIQDRNGGAVTIRVISENTI